MAHREGQKEDGREGALRKRPEFPHSEVGGVVGVALGSGSARGWAHIGVLKRLVEAGVRVEAVAGTSMGALVGASFALGKLEQLERFASHLDWRQILSFLDLTLPVSGLIEGNRISEFVRQHLKGDVLIEKMPLPFCALAADLATGREVRLDEGDLIEAVRASISVPGIFTPLRRGEDLLVDGGLVNPVPVSVLRDMGADFVIAVDLNHDLVNRRRGGGVRKTPRGPRDVPDGGEEGIAGLAGQFRARMSALNVQVLERFRNWAGGVPGPNIFEVILGSVNVMQARITAANLERDPPDLIIRPKLGHIPFMAFNRSREAIEEGYRAAASHVA